MKYTEIEMRGILADSRYQDIGNLPSNFYPYEKDGLKKLYIRPFTVKELRLVSKAAMLKDLSHLHRAVNLVCAYDSESLSAGDFYYVLMWLRIHSMPKTPYVVEWHCQEPVIVNKETGRRILNDESHYIPEDEENWKIQTCDAHNSEVIYMASVDILTLDEENYSGIPNEGGSVLFDFPRARILQELIEAQKDPELQLIIGAAQWVSDENLVAEQVPVKKGEEPITRMVPALTLAQKIKVLEDQPDLQAFDDAAVINETIIHGVSEQTTLTCRDCMLKTPHKLVIDPFSFFR